MLRFSIRDVFWLILVVAVGMGWYVSRQSWLAHEHALQVEVKRAQREEHNARVDVEILRDRLKSRD